MSKIVHAPTQNKMLPYKATKAFTINCGNSASAMRVTIERAHLEAVSARQHLRVLSLRVVGVMLKECNAGARRRSRASFLRGATLAGIDLVKDRRMRAALLLQDKVKPPFVPVALHAVNALAPPSLNQPLPPSPCCNTRHTRHSFVGGRALAGCAKSLRNRHFEPGFGNNHLYRE